MYFRRIAAVAERLITVVRDQGANEDIFDALTMDSAGALYAVGVIGGAGTVDFGNHATAAGTKLDGPGWSPLLVKYE